MIHVKFFAYLRERLDCNGINMEYRGQPTVAVVRQELLGQDSRWQPLAEMETLVAVNQVLCSEQYPISDGDEVAFFPPVTGG